MKPGLPDCQSAVSKGLSRLDKPTRLAFFAAFLSGLATHLYMFAGKYPNHDDIICLFEHDATVTSGRWFLELLIRLSASFSMPYINGLISLFALSVMAVLIIRLLEIKKPLEIVLASFALISFPSVGNAFGFLFTADGYCLGFLLGTLAAYLTDTRKWGFLFAFPLLTLAIGAYQATLCFYVSILAVRGLQLLLTKALTDREVWIRLAKYAGVAVLSAVCYVLLSKLALALTGQQMEAYVGLENMGQLQLSKIPSMILSAYTGFFRFAFYTSGVHVGLHLSILHLIIGASVFILIALLLIKNGAATKAQLLLAVAVTALLPLLLNSASMLGSTRVHIIMMYGVSMIYLLLIVLTEAYLALPAKTKNRALSQTLFSWVTALSIFLSSFCWYIYTNQSYLMLQLKYENAYAMTNRVIARIEASPLYAPDLQVALIGEFVNGNYPHSKDGNFGSLGGDEGFGGPDEFGFIYDDRHFKDFTRWYSGVNLSRMDEEKLKQLSRSAEFAALPSYPEAGSMALIDGTLVIKAGEIDD